MKTTREDDDEVPLFVLLPIQRARLSQFALAQLGAFIVSSRRKSASIQEFAKLQSSDEQVAA